MSESYLDSDTIAVSETMWHADGSIVPLNYCAMPLSNILKRFKFSESIELSPFEDLTKFSEVFGDTYRFGYDGLVIDRTTFSTRHRFTISYCDEDKATIRKLQDYDVENVDRAYWLSILDIAVYRNIAMIGKRISWAETQELLTLHRTR